MRTILAPALAMIALPSVGVAYLSFADGCQAMDGQFYSDDKVGFFCFTKDVKDYMYKYSTIDLGHCIGNNNGALVGHSDGRYQDTCDGCTLNPKRDGQYVTNYIQCTCIDMDGDKAQTSLDLNDVLVNDDGRLVCYSYGGTRQQQPPECHHNLACSTVSPRLTPRARLTLDAAVTVIAKPRN